MNASASSPRRLRRTSRGCGSSSPIAREPRNQVGFRGINSLYRDANYETIVLNGLYFPAVDFLASFATAIVLGYGGYLLLHDQVSVGTLLAFFLYLANFFDPVQQLSQLYNTFLSATAALDKIIEVLDEEPEIVDGAAALELPRIDGHVRFEAVRFGYGTLPEVLHGIDLDVPPGTSVALVGQTGAGKSTIAKLIARFYDPREGRVTIDGHDVRDVQQRSLRRQLGVVPQEGFLFAGTVAQNIAFARPDATRADDRSGPHVPSAPIPGFASSRTATTPSSASGASGSRSGSGSSLPLRGRCSPIRAS